MTRKNATEALFNGELLEELLERKLESRMSLSSKSSREGLMWEIDRMRRTELYPHPPEDCNQHCREKGTVVFNLKI